MAVFIIDNAPAVDYNASIVNDQANLFLITYAADTTKFTISLVKQPSLNNVAVGAYGPLKIQATDATTGNTVTGYVTVSIYPSVITDPNLSDLQSTTPSSSGSMVGIAVGVVCGCIALVLIIVAVVVRQRKRTLVLATRDPYDAIGAGGAGVDTLGNPTYFALHPGDQMYESTATGGNATGNPMYFSQSADTYAAAGEGDFAPGVANPMYAWYRPDMGRQDVEEYLIDQVDGAFVIRDSTATPGWHMLAVKTSNAIVHEKIKMSDAGMYELLPSSARSQPGFNGIPDLVEHYSRQQDGVRYALALDNPLYDNNHLQSKSGGAVAAAWYAKDADAPSVPLKEREKETLGRLAQDGEEFYTNAQQAKGVMSNA